MLTDAELCLEQQSSELRSHLKFKFLEAKFIHSYLKTLSFQYVGLQSSPAFNDDPIDSIPTKVHALYDKIAKFASPVQQQSFADDVVCFNVRGESVCLLKSTILQVIPNSQLGLQLGSKSKSSRIKTELVRDKEGRIIVVSIKWEIHIASVYYVIVD
jgi:hypothetical protein